MAASEESVASLELFQVQSQEGPCQDAYPHRRACGQRRLAGGRRSLAAFRPRVAVNAGFRSVHAFPLRLRAERIGAMNVFSKDVGGRLDASDMQIVQALADVASIGLLQERAISRGEQLTEQLQGALNSRIIIEQAKGAVAQHKGVSVDDAFTLIRSYARANNLRLGDVAKTVIADAAYLPDL
jgi:GAF domain-containing protein